MHMLTRLEMEFPSLTFEERDDIVKVSQRNNENDIFSNPFIYWPCTSEIKLPRKRTIVEMMRRRWNIKDEDDRRIVAYMKHVLKQEKGHCFMPWNNFTAKLFADNNLGPVLEGQVDLARLCAESDELHADHADVYLQRLYRCELKIADHLQALLRKEGRWNPTTKWK